MSQVKDPVCGMMVDSASPYHAEQDGRTYHFCSEACQTRFQANPSQFHASGGATDGAHSEQHEPPRTVSGGWFAAPKFGSAGSGGAEYDQLPEKHDGGH